ncbi:MAG: hypothetical protein OEU92_08210 [Alphaproteobacteria bacterium]|nr:hypothetical protein [Alphaproteobacteria bacterium]
MAFSWVLRKRKSDTGAVGAERASETRAPAICLKVEDGLLMAFGPDGDPVPPSLVKSTGPDDTADELLLEGGQWVDRQRVLDVLDAQQKAPLADQPTDLWIKAMLGLAGGFEPTPSERLANEPDGPAPALPNSALEGNCEADDPMTEWVTSLVFDETECAEMVEADALLVRGLTNGMRLSAGRFDPVLNGWVLSPRQLPALAIQRAEGAASQVAIDVTAVSTEGGGRRWPATAKEIDLA